HEAYTHHISTAFSKIGRKIKGVHEYKDPKSAIEQAEATYVGGGNTFLWLSQLYKLNVFPPPT
ncbi:MAG: Type 1 glutamine amidotransferase-like domain-containing protein, partial [Bacteroidota bacterium]